MNIDSILNLIPYTVPAIVVAGVSYVFFQKIVERQSQRDKFIIDQLSKPTSGDQTQIDSKALKLQACERLVIFAERSNIQKILLRVVPVSESVPAYANLLIQHIEQEFEYNVTQQLYVSPTLWSIITTTKNSTLQMIQQVANNSKDETLQHFQSALLDQSIHLHKSLDILLKAINEESKFNLK